VFFDQKTSQRSQISHLIVGEPVFRKARGLWVFIDPRQFHATPVKGNSLPNQLRRVKLNIIGINRSGPNATHENCKRIHI